MIKAGKISGYLHPDYAGSLSEYGVPRQLPRCNGWILERTIPGCSYSDAMGCYPIFTCSDWSQLYADLSSIEDLVSVSMVIDPFGDCDERYLHRCFVDVVIPYKESFVIDLSRRMDSFVSEHHRRNARRALSAIKIERCLRPEDVIDEWISLYDNLIERHRIKGIAAFSRESFIRQFKVPGLVVFRALHDGRTIGMLLLYVQGDVGYYHLASYSHLGYEMHASFGLFWHVIEWLANEGVRWFYLGGGAGLNSNDNDGLSRFKRGWSTGARTLYFCGRIFDHVAYAEIAQGGHHSVGDYFPSYRKHDLHF